GPARPRRADPRGRAGRLAARLGRDGRGDGSIQGRTDGAGHTGASGGGTMTRTATVDRETKESKVHVEVDIDGSGRADVSTGVGFYHHLLPSFARHALVDLVAHTSGDTHVDAHHTVEDVAIVLGEALREALGDKAGIARFGDALVPLDETLVQAAVDVSGRPYCVHTGEAEGQQYVLIGGSYVGSLTRHVFETLAHHAAIALHVRVLSGRDPHHAVEAQFKAVAGALRVAVSPDPRVGGVPSTKGVL